MVASLSQMRGKSRGETCGCEPHESQGAKADVSGHISLAVRAVGAAAAT
jgi:hypothetical protein